MEIVYHVVNPLCDRDGLVECFLQIFVRPFSPFLGFEVEDHGFFGADWG